MNDIICVTIGQVIDNSVFATLESVVGIDIDRRIEYQVMVCAKDSKRDVLDLHSGFRVVLPDVYYDRPY